MYESKASIFTIFSCSSPLTSQEQDVELKTAICQHERFVGSGACVPLTSQEHEVVLKAAVCQHERPVGSGACVPVISHEQVNVLKTELGPLWERVLKEQIL